MFKVLKKFNFGDSFIGMIRTLYNDLIFKVKNNGWIKKIIHNGERDIMFQLFFSYWYLKYKRLKSEIIWI